MKEQFSEEILSAYVDGELTAAERAEIERWLDTNPAAREQVDDLRRLSKLLAGLPRTEVPREFPTTVLQLAERRMLLPEMTVVATKRRVRRWAFAILAPLASAAVLLLLLQNFLPGPGLPQPAVVDNKPAPLPMPVAVRTAGGESGLDEMVGDGPLLAGKDGRANGQLAEINRAIDEVRDADDSDKFMSVVTVHVVDRAQGLTLLQSIFSEKRDFADGVNVPEKSGDRADLKQAGGAAARASGGKEALYIEAAPEQLMAAFTAILKREDAALRLTVEEPLELAALDADSQEQIVAGNRAPAGRSPQRRDAGANPVAADVVESELAKAPGDDAPDADKAKVEPAPATPETRAKKKSIAAPRPDSPRPDARAEDVAGNKEKFDSREAPVEEKQTRVSLAMRSAEAAPARLYVVQVPKQLEQRKSRALAKQAQPLPAAAPAGQESAASAAPSRAALAPGADGKTVTEAKKSKRAPSLVRVLLVIEPDAVPAAPAVPAAGKGPSGGAS